MTHLIYIGNKDKDFLTGLEQKENIQITHADNYLDAINLCMEKRSSRHTIVFFEQGKLTEDVTHITKFRKKFYQGYVILVTGGLSREESEAYLKCGINDTIHPDATAQELESKITKIKRRQELLYANDRNKKQVKRFVLPLWKRIFDIVFSSIAIIVLSPIFLLIAIAIRLESKGNIIYKSKRVGTNYTIFDFFKFRSMYTDADKRLKELKDGNVYQESASSPINKQEINQEDLGNLMIGDEGVMLVSDDFIIPEEDFSTLRNAEQNNAFVKIEKDPRVTKVGRFIRRYSLDELPQLFNILRGDMPKACFPWRDAPSVFLGRAINVYTFFSASIIS